MSPEKNKLAATVLAVTGDGAKMPQLQHEELQISISADLLRELLAKKSIRACEVRCLNPETSERLKAMCMDCCAKNLFVCPAITPTEINVLQPLVSSLPTKTVTG